MLINEETHELAQHLQDISYRGRQMTSLEAHFFADRAMRWLEQRGYERHFLHYLAAGSVRPRSHPGGKDGMYDATCACGEYSAWPAQTALEAVQRVQAHADAKNEGS